MSAPSNYLTLTLRGLGFDTFKTNLLVIPSKVLHVINMLALTYAGEVFGELTFISLIGQSKLFPFFHFLVEKICKIRSIATPVGRHSLGISKPALTDSQTP